MGRVEIVTLTVGARAKEGKRGRGTGEKFSSLSLKNYYSLFIRKLVPSVRNNVLEETFFRTDCSDCFVNIWPRKIISLDNFLKGYPHNDHDQEITI